LDKAYLEAGGLPILLPFSAGRSYKRETRIDLRFNYGPG
jgi:hypothetical protein